MLLSMIQSVLLSQNTGSITGRITDKKTGEALPGATVLIKGTTVSEVTNNEGNFIIKKMKAGKFILQVSYVGYETVETAVTISGVKE